MRYVEFKEYKKGKAGQLKGKDAFKKKSKPGGNETPHPARGKLVGESLYEADARIQHAEDIVFWEGSKGAMRALEALRSMAKEETKNVHPNGTDPHRFLGAMRMENSYSPTKADLEKRAESEEPKVQMKLKASCSVVQVANSEMIPFHSICR